MTSFEGNRPNLVIYRFFVVDGVFIVALLDQTVLQPIQVFGRPTTPKMVREILRKLPSV